MFPRGMQKAVIKACQKGNAVNPISTKYYRSQQRQKDSLEEEFVLKNFCKHLCQQSSARGICTISHLTLDTCQHLILLLSSVSPYFFSACPFLQPCKCQRLIAQLLLQKIILSFHPIIKWSEYSPIWQNVDSLLFVGVCKLTPSTFQASAA